MLDVIIIETSSYNFERGLLFSFKATFTHYSVKNYLQAPILNSDPEPVLTETSFLDHLREKLNIRILSNTDEEMVFDLIGVDASIANALRRILLAEVRQKQMINSLS